MDNVLRNSVAQLPELREKALEALIDRMGDEQAAFGRAWLAQRDTLKPPFERNGHKNQWVELEGKHARISWSFSDLYATGNFVQRELHCSLWLEFLIPGNEEEAKKWMESDEKFAAEHPDGRVWETVKECAPK